MIFHKSINWGFVTLISLALFLLACNFRVPFQTCMKFLTVYLGATTLISAFDKKQIPFSFNQTRSVRGFLIVMSLFFIINLLKFSSLSGIIFINIVTIFAVHVFQIRQKVLDRTNNQHFFVWVIFLMLVLMHTLATFDFKIKGFYANLWFGLILYIAFVNVNRLDRSFFLTYFNQLAFYMPIFYVATQMYFIMYKLVPYGTANNNLILSLYSSLFFPVTLYQLFTKTSYFKKMCMLIVSIVLIYFVLMCSVRPAWIAIFIGQLWVLMYLPRHKRFIFVAFIILSQSILYIGNILNYQTRIDSLIEGIKTEERVYIWRDAWNMQLDSSLKEWLVGHGIGSFKNAFKEYSSMRAMRDFRSPHNILMDSLFSVGVLGMLSILTFYVFTYSRLILLFKHSDEVDKRKFTCLLLILFTVLLIHNGIELPFFMHYNIIPLTLFLVALHFVSDYKVKLQ